MKTNKHPHDVIIENAAADPFYALSENDIAELEATSYDDIYMDFELQCMSDDDDAWMEAQFERNTRRMMR